jgi:hypothetical protein
LWIGLAWELTIFHRSSFKTQMAGVPYHEKGPDVLGENL